MEACSTFIGQADHGFWICSSQESLMQIKFFFVSLHVMQLRI